MFLTLGDICEWCDITKQGKQKWTKYFEKMCFEQKIDRDNELPVSGGKEFQSCGTMTEKTLLSRDVQTYGMDRPEGLTSLTSAKNRLYPDTVDWSEIR